MVQRISQYATWEEASEAVQELCIESRREYAERFEDDPRLPAEPWKFYDNYPGNGQFFNIQND